MASFEILLKEALEEVTTQIQANSNRIDDIESRLDQTAEILSDEMTSYQITAKNEEQATHKSIAYLMER